MEECIYVNQEYQKRIMEILNDQTIPLYVREHMSESPNWLQNYDMKRQIDTFVWISKSEEEKREGLNEELKHK